MTSCTYRTVHLFSTAQSLGIKGLHDSFFFFFFFLSLLFHSMSLPPFVPLSYRSFSTIANGPVFARPALHWRWFRRGVRATPYFYFFIFYVFALACVTRFAYRHSTHSCFLGRREDQALERDLNTTTRPIHINSSFSFFLGSHRSVYFLHDSEKLKKKILLIKSTLVPREVEKKQVFKEKMGLKVGFTNTRTRSLSIDIVNRDFKMVRLVFLGQSWDPFSLDNKIRMVDFLLGTESITSILAVCLFSIFQACVD